MNKTLVVAALAASIMFATVGGRDNPTSRTQVPSHSRRPSQTRSSKAALKMDLENLQRELNELQKNLYRMPAQPQDYAKHACNSKTAAAKKHTHHTTKKYGQLRNK